MPAFADKAIDGAAEHVLRQIGGVGVLQAALAEVAVDERRVQVHELSPGVLILEIAQPF